MRRNWVGLAMLAALVAGSTGCRTVHKKVQRPEMVQEYNLPPQDDRRYSQPPALPVKVLLDDPMARRRDAENSAKDLQGPMMQGANRPGGPAGPMP